MKKATLALAVLAAGTTAAWAQPSTVTMYGIVDAAMKRTSNANPGVSKNTLANSGLSQSRLGFTINEDLGGGMRALANLEHRLSLDTGTTAGSSPAGVFWFQSWVGLASNDFGVVTLGRQYNVLFDLNATTFSSYKYSTYIDQYKPELGMTLNNRQDNMVKYKFVGGPVTAELQVSAGEGSAVDKSAGGAIKYQSGPFAFGGGYLQTEGASAATSLGKKVKGTILGGAYTDGPIYVNLSWMKNKFDAGANVLAATYAAGFLNGAALTALTTGAGAPATSSQQRDMIMFGGTYQLTTQINLGAEYYHMEHKIDSTGAKYKSDFLSFVADYAFSKRTDAYFEADRTNFKNGEGYTNGASRRYQAMVGLRHRF
ncbi:porin [Pelomonas sp. KK5]|uniref:porin n=1 Tax=Pelomonas sp. KK5 TaxID=1855730 RepID=UPI00097C3772|nr:porin [Pelomonas sp. KK5]